jgi:hypothetical protein
VPDNLLAGLDDTPVQTMSVGHVLCPTYCSPAEFATLVHNA